MPCHGACHLGETSQKVTENVAQLSQLTEGGHIVDDGVAQALHDVSRRRCDAAYEILG